MACPIQAWTWTMVDGDRAEGVAQVVEAQRPDAGALEGVLVAAAQRGVVEVLAALTGEDEIVARRARRRDEPHLSAQSGVRPA
jgi:VIT1/CCC1 family predicted Fe2+/Mn2+ transporter